MRTSPSAAAICSILAVFLLCSCGRSDRTAGSSCNIKAAVIGGNSEINETFNQLENGIIANIDTAYMSQNEDFSDCDIVYLDKQTDNEQYPDAKKIESFVYNGGTAVLDNSLLTSFSTDFLGASELVPITGCPANLEFAEVEDDLMNISELLYDFTTALKGYTNYESYASYSYGVGIIPSTAQTIASYEGTAVYAVNKYGDGYVFITNPMLPSDYMISYLTEGETGEPLAFSTAGAETLLRSYFSEFVSKKKYGFAVERTFGSFASRPAAWELHYEDITGVKNNSLETFSLMCMEKGQMPSYTTARNIYTWFKRAESVTYMLGDNNGFKPDPYENAYCSGTHIVSSGEWLELDSYDNTDSYFEDNPEYIKRAYPCPTDFNKDGRIDLICGSADGKFYYYEGYGMKENYEMSIATLLTDENGNALNVGSYSSPAMLDINGDGIEELLSGSEDGIIRAFRRKTTEENLSSLVFEPMGEILQTSLPDSMISCGDLNGDGIADLAVGSRSGEMRVYCGYTDDGHTTKFSDFVPVVSQQTWVSPCIYGGKLYGGTSEGYVAHYSFNGTEYTLSDYLECDDISRRGNSRITIGMNSVLRFADIDGDGIDDLICGSLEYGMAYPIDSSYFPYRDELEEQFRFCRDYNIYMGVHGFTHKYATPEHEKQELEYHKKAFDTLNLTWEGLGANQHTWFTSKYGYDGSGEDGYNPSYNGTFDSQYQSGLLWNSGSTLPESDAVPQKCAENAIPIPMYMPDKDFLLLETSNTPHGYGEYSYTSVKYDMPMLFYNHCDYIYQESDEQLTAVDKVGKLVNDFNYVFVGENQMAKSVSAAYNADIEAYRTDDGSINITAGTKDETRGLYDKKYSGCVGVKVVFAASESGENYTPDASVWNYENGGLYISLDKPVTIEKGIINNKTNLKQINVPAKVKVKNNSAEIDFKESGLMYVRVAGDADTTSSGWTIHHKDGDTVFMKFGKAQKLNIRK